MTIYKRIGLSVYMNNPYQLYLTRQSMGHLKYLKRKQPKVYAQIISVQLPELCRFPFQGRLLLNRQLVDSEATRLCQQLCQRFPGAEFRDICCHNWLLLYLNHKPKLFLLDVISLNSAFSEFEHYWQRQ